MSPCRVSQRHGMVPQLPWKFVIHRTVFVFFGGGRGCCLLLSSLKRTHQPPHKLEIRTGTLFMMLNITMHRSRDVTRKDNRLQEPYKRNVFQGWFGVYCVRRYVQPDGRLKLWCVRHEESWRGLRKTSPGQVEMTPWVMSGCNTHVVVKTWVAWLNLIIPLQAPYPFASGVLSYCFRFLFFTSRNLQRHN